MPELPRLLSVRLRGFKTFAKPTELSFEPGVTVIIGPNGSGKSNIADAVLWVLGEQSPGNLRGRSMQDVIFSGPDGRRSSAVAEVSLVFDNEQGALPVDSTEVEVTRRLERDGGSEYRVNGSACRLLDVQDLVAGLGIGREMHSVISQGKVETLLNSTPEVRRAMVEEAAGLGRFKKRRERAQAKLERTRQNLVRMADVEREVKNALRPLRQQAAAAGRFAEAKEEWAQAKARHLLAQAASIHEVSRRTEEELSALETDRAATEAELTGLRRERATEEDRFAAALQERERLGAIYHRLAVEAEQVQGKSTSLRQRLARIEADLERARRRSEVARIDMESLGQRLALAAARTADEDRLERVTGWGQRLREALDEAVAEFRGMAAAEDELKDSVFEMESARARALQDREFLRREMEARVRIDDELVALEKELGERVDSLAAEAARQAEVLQTCEGETTAEAARLEQAVAALEAARVRVTEAMRRETSLSQELSGVESRRTVLEDLVRRREGTSAGAKDLMVRASGSRLLAEVIEVEAGYERAAAAALGPLAQAVVLGSSDDLQMVLDGDDVLEAVVTGAFPNPGAASPPLPAGTRGLWDLVGGPPHLIETLRALVPPTAILMDDARLGPTEVALSRGPYRLVNRRGEMAQSGAHVARRREMGAETLLQARNELQSAAEERVVLDEAFVEAAAEARQAEADLEDAEASVRHGQEQLTSAERRLAGARNDSELTSRRLDEAGLQLVEVRARQERESGLAAQMRAELEQAEERISGRQAELDAARAELRSIQNRLEQLRVNVSMLEEKKSQAALVEVRLRERCRAQEGERHRLMSQRDAARVSAERWERRLTFLEGYLPLLEELAGLVDHLAERSHSVRSGFEGRLEEARAAAEGAARLMRDTAGSESGLQRRYEGMGERLTQLRVDRARQQDRRDVVDEELADLRRRHLSPRSLTVADVAGENLDLLEAAEERAARRVERLGPVNPLAEQECAELEERAAFLAEQRRDLEASLTQLQEVVSDLDDHIDHAFADMFEAVREHFSAVIATVFPGAKGSLKLIEVAATAIPLGEGTSTDDASSADLEEGLLEEAKPAVRGIGLEVKFANKSPRSLSLLSGGEKAMTAIAFLFSLFLARPCPFYVLDEVEASLDDINIRRFLSLVRRYRERTQFVIITHQRQTMEVADTLYGVTLEGDGTSRILSRRLSVAKGA